MDPKLNESEQPLTTGRLLELARQTVPELPAQEVKARIDRTQFDLVLDVRESGEWQKGHLPRALHAPRGMLEWYADPGSKYARPEITAHREGKVLVACGSGGRSLLAAQTLQRMGYRNVASLAGGFTEWIKHGFPVEG